MKYEDWANMEEKSSGNGCAWIFWIII